ncbi:hypothetical protein CCAND93_530022 [Capnocytophaga canis]|uniref:Uncharacterized protein n=1 Tax=Capnocytophaga canis TaxID=1848903 RepID=A0A0B7IPJ0_9FLAO|nr:hypothetical protein CAPN008_02290 [Capnocytophaga canis]CEN53720.1 hypothetical protein CCAND93_530022 [Capnocytophaga canis]
MKKLLSYRLTFYVILNLEYDTILRLFVAKVVYFFVEPNRITQVEYYSQKNLNITDENRIFVIYILKFMYL